MKQRFEYLIQITVKQSDDIYLFFQKRKDVSDA